ncbi:MAG: 16S rRNA (guanine(966)-N(2))-methyltransferase RsmD [Sphingomonadaceae bacterium]|nr:16S rRNA (guanine(966)-N(2))-methyltransferase RsmD [Sphingomonadaceae bacterium]
MRIIAGQWRARPLLAPPGETTRPTSDRAREALFSMLASRVGSFEGLAVADLFAGSGALGLEALSRGAGRCLFVENDSAAIASLRSNIAAYCAVNAEIRATSVLALGPAATPFDLLLLDPPYGAGLATPALAHLAQQGWIAPTAWISVETARGEPLDAQGLAVDTIRTFGKAQITLLRA